MKCSACREPGNGNMKLSQTSNVDKEEEDRDEWASSANLCSEISEFLYKATFFLQ